MDRLDTRLNNALRDRSLFRAVVPVRGRSYYDPKMPVPPMGMAIDNRGAGHIVKMGGVCKRWFGRRYGLQIYFFP
jgi:hypothetical protein